MKGIMPMKDVFELSLPDLLYFVKESCHENLHETLHVLRKLSKGPTVKSELSKFIAELIEEIQLHLDIEEKSFFPQLELRRGNAEATIVHLIDDHDKLKARLLKLRKMTRNYYLPASKDKREETLYLTLKEMDRIILNHIQIENHVLFPMLTSAAPKVS